MTTLQDLKAEYQARLDFKAIEQAEQDTQREALRQLKLDGLKPRIITWIANREGVDEVELSQYGEVTGDWSEWNNRYDSIKFTLTFLDHQPVSFYFYENAEGKVLPKINPRWSVDQSGKNPETLGEALTLAAQVYQQNQEYLEREEADSLLYEAQKVDKEDRKAREQKQQQDTLIELAKDPVAFLLLKLFAEIQAERANLRNEMDGLNEAMSNADYYYDEIMTGSRRKIEQERQEVERVKDALRQAQDEVVDLGDELRKAKKQGGGW